MAHLLALKSKVENEAIIVTARVPFTRDDGPTLRRDAASVIRRYYSLSRELEGLGIELPSQLERCYSIAKAERLLGYEPKYNFDWWLTRILGQ